MFNLLAQPGLYDDILGEIQDVKNEASLLILCELHRSQNRSIIPALRPFQPNHGKQILLPSSSSFPYDDTQPIITGITG